MKSKTLKSNFFFNALQQVVTLVLPLFLIPYLSRVIGPTGIGTYSYTFSITQYFVIFGTIGLNLYGTRQIAYLKNSPDECKKEFFRIFYLRSICSIVALLVYLSIFLFINTEYKVFFIINSFLLLGNLIDVSWYFQGLERFDIICFANVLVRVIAFVLIFLLVKNESDTINYILIQALSIFAIGLILILFLIKERPILCPFKEVFQHFLPALRLFVPQIAIELYVIFDKTMLGLLADVESVAFYTKAEEFAKIPLTFIGILATVLFPRISNMVKNNTEEEVKSFLNNYLQIIIFIGFAAAFGICAISKKFVNWMLGEEFSRCIVLLYLLSPLSIIIGTSNMLGKQYLIPKNRIKMFTISVVSGALTNIALNFVLIPFLKDVGACIATLVAELVVTTIQFIYLYRIIEKKRLMLNSLKYIFAGVAMFLLVFFIGDLLTIQIVDTLVQILVGIIVYCLILFMFKDETILTLFRKVFLRRKKNEVD